MNAQTNVAQLKQPQTSLMAVSEDELMNVLRNSLYVGAQDESIKLVISYCKANGLDPMQKPVHIVPMYASTGKKDAKGYDIKAMRDVIMPGIGLYRTQAARSGNYAGVTEPEFGPDINEELGGVQITYPKWCKVTVKRALPNGQSVDFSATEFWKENYSTKGKDSAAPNSMWLKRPYGQIAKCTEAQALRKAFPEFGSAPTADEMEGKEIDVTPNSEQKRVEEKKPELIQMTDEGLVKLSADKIDGEGVILKMGSRSLIQCGERTAADLITHLSAKYKLEESHIETIKSWEAIEGEIA